MRFKVAALLLVAGLVASYGGDVAFKRLARVATGPRGYVPIVLADLDHDSFGEIASASATAGGQPCWEVLSYRPVNRYVLVHAETGYYYMGWPPVPMLGNFYPFDTADLDRDGKAELIGEIHYADTVAGCNRQVACVVESRDANSYPDTVVWAVPDTSAGSGDRLVWKYVTDLDRDGCPEITSHWGNNTAIFENVGPDRESLVFCRPHAAQHYAFGDFDGNGATDFVYGPYLWLWVSECVGDNQYQVVCSLYTGLSNGYDIFAGNDVDHNGLPEFFVVYALYRMPGWMLYLYQFEAAAPHSYQYFWVDSLPMTGAASPPDEASLCADVDGDGVDEVIWSLGVQVRVMKGLLPHRFEAVYTWPNDHGSHYTSMCNAADFNGNGYNEVYIAGDCKVSVLEVEAVRVLNPDRTRELEAGDTCSIRWRVYQPPRCDSVSLFLKTDTVVREGERFWRLDTIVTGLGPTESTHAWSVPETTLGWAKVLAIAYGPGWQFDESDSSFAIRPHGVGEVRAAAVWQWQPPAVIRGMVQVPPAIPGLRVPVLVLCDVAGRGVMELRPGPNPVRHLASGVYFVREQGSGAQGSQGSSHKVVIAR
jgi:hypothetical protein